MKIIIKNMVCLGTKSFVIQELEKLGIKYLKFEANEIEIENDLTLPEIKRLDHAFRQIGLEIVIKKSKLVRKIRNIIHDMIENKLIMHTGPGTYISKILGYNYFYLNSYFYKETGLAIEEYYVARQEDRIMEGMRKFSQALFNVGD